tara:strand:- start:171 stop:536 length:366 start_codon:yes stop_codon:yes gene_type:complete
MTNVNNVRKKRQKKAFLESLANGTSISKAATAAGITIMTIWRWRRKSKSFDEDVLSVMNSRTQEVEDALYIKAVKGNVIAQIFWLKNRAKDRWKDKIDSEVDDKVEITVKLPEDLVEKESK